MASGYRVGTTDLDDIFDPYQSGAKAGITNKRVGSQDLRDRYNPISEGSSAAVTNHRVGSTDLNQIFAKKGTSTRAQIIPFGDYHVSAGGSHNVGGSITLSLMRAGTWSVALAVTGNGGTGTSGTPLSGTWHMAPGSTVGDDYQVRFVAAISTSGNTAPAYTATTGWLPLSSTRSVTASVHLLDGSSGQYSGHASGTYTVQIRKTSTGVVRESIMQLHLDAQG